MSLLSSAVSISGNCWQETTEWQWSWHQQQGDIKSPVRSVTSPPVTCQWWQVTAPSSWQSLPVTTVQPHRGENRYEWHLF